MSSIASAYNPLLADNFSTNKIVFIMKLYTIKCCILRINGFIFCSSLQEVYKKFTRNLQETAAKDESIDSKYTAFNCVVSL